MKQPPRFTLLGVLLTSLAILTLEIVLTRVFSVLMSYHFAFMVISLALLGSGIAGAWLYLASRQFPPEKTRQRLSLLASLFALDVTAAFIIYLRIPFQFKSIPVEGLSWSSIGWLALIFLVLTTPFLLGGAVMALAISRYSQSAGRVYSYDLVGAGLGCMVSIVALTAASAAGAVLLVSVLAAIAALCFAWPDLARWRWVSLIVVLVTVGLFASNQANPWLQVRTRDSYDANNVMLYEKWNALSRITVYEDPYWMVPFGWGLSTRYEGLDPGHLMMVIDADAGTPIQRWDGTTEMVDFLRYDLTSIAYYTLPAADAFIIGAGGGRDIVAGLLFGANTITAAEINPAIVDAARYQFGDYAGHVYDQPNVRVAVVDARTFLSGSDQEFDLIQASLIDTWAASSSGAYSLSENGLYTREAFLTYYDRLSERGMVSYSRWYFIAEPTETLRLVALGLESWREAGAANPADHMIVIANLAQNRAANNGLATVLLKKTPFTSAEVETFARTSEEMKFTVLYAPGYTAVDNAVQALVTAVDLPAAIAAYPLDISVPTDNHPFFFNFARFEDMGRSEYKDNPAYHSSIQGNYALLAVLGIAAVFAVLFILGPLTLRRRQDLALGRSWPYLLYYAALGVGFMLILVPSIQKLTIYLGSPTYALTVVLFTILVGSGIGSSTTHAISDEGVRPRLRRIITGLLLVVALHLLLLPALTRLTQHWHLYARVALVILVIFPAGFFMGQPFPLGLKWVSRRRAAIVPWLWAVNGVTSVIGSALATVLALATDFIAVSVIGMACYGLALALAHWAWAGERELAQLTPGTEQSGLDPLAPGVQTASD